MGTDYNDELKNARKMLKSEMLKAGIKDFSMKGSTGSSWGWTDISKKQGDWTAKDQKALMNFGMDVGHPSNSLMTRDAKELRSALYGYKAKKFKAKPKYKKFVSDFIETARKQSDHGTCVLGAGTFILKDGKEIDKIRQQGQGETRNWVAQKMMQNRAKELGLVMKHEGGMMD